MTEPTNQFMMSDDLDDISALAPAEWLAALRDIALELGQFEQIGRDHAAAYLEGDDVLLVSFCSQAQAAAVSPNGYPVGFNIALDNGWSHLSLVSLSDEGGAPWFRASDLYAYFDSLVLEGLFEDFDRVVFYGAGAAGYAACAYSVTAPGAEVIAIAPQATLEGRLSSWDPRFKSAKRADFTTRYGFAPAMLDGAGKATVIYDPLVAEDAVHAALFNATHIERRPVQDLGADPEALLMAAGALEPMLQAAADEHLDPRTLTRLLRLRRSQRSYLRAKLNRLETMKRPAYVAALSRFTLKSFGRAPRFARALKEAEAAMGHTASEDTSA